MADLRSLAPGTITLRKIGEPEIDSRARLAKRYESGHPELLCMRPFGALAVLPELNFLV